MTSKKKMGSKLASSVRQVKSEREQKPVVPAKPITLAKPASKPTAVVPTTPVFVPQATKKTDLDSQHPQRVWPD